MLDVVYVCRSGPNEELRYSLRSLVNLPHRRVLIAGAAPDWYAGHVLQTPTVVRRTVKHAHALANLTAALLDDTLTNDIIYMNDDFFIMQPHDSVPVLHGGELEDRHLDQELRYPKARYTVAMSHTRNILRAWGYDKAVCYDLHVPMVLNRQSALAVLQRTAAEANALDVPDPERLHWRTIYGNVMGIGGVEAPDCKVYDSGVGDWSNWPLLSTQDLSFRSGQVGRYIGKRFPKPFRYELGANLLERVAVA